MTYYHGVADEPGDVFVSIDGPDSGPDFVDACRELGVTWLLTTEPYEEADPYDEAAHAASLEHIRDGPPT